jgi:hypothetical protein
MQRQTECSQRKLLLLNPPSQVQKEYITFHRDRNIFIKPFSLIATRKRPLTYFYSWGQGVTGPRCWKDAECVHPSLKGVKMVSVSNSEVTYDQILK